MGSYVVDLRHGWGIPPDPPLAITYLSQAASNSASVESQALASGLKTGGAAKGELVLAIYELANCFRHGWGVGKDPIAARSYYETAANLGDTDAMNEVARCYEDGFGGKKDKVSRIVPQIDSVWSLNFFNHSLKSEAPNRNEGWASDVRLRRVPTHDWMKRLTRYFWHSSKPPLIIEPRKRKEIKYLVTLGKSVISRFIH